MGIFFSFLNSTCNFIFVYNCRWYFLKKKTFSFHKQTNKQTRSLTAAPWSGSYSILSKSSHCWARVRISFFFFLFSFMTVCFPKTYLLPSTSLISSPTSIFSNNGISFWTTHAEERYIVSSVVRPINFLFTFLHLQALFSKMPLGQSKNPCSELSAWV